MVFSVRLMLHRPGPCRSATRTRMRVTRSSTLDQVYSATLKPSVLRRRTGTAVCWSMSQAKRLVWGSLPPHRPNTTTLEQFLFPGPWDGSLPIP